VVQKYPPSFACQGASQFAEPPQVPGIQITVRDIEDASVVGHKSKLDVSHAAGGHLACRCRRPSQAHLPRWNPQCKSSEK
jgi:hypothetical protein